MFPGFSERVLDGDFSPVPGYPNKEEVGIHIQPNGKLTTKDRGENWYSNCTVKVGRLKTDRLKVANLDFDKLPELAKTADLGKVVVSDGKEGLKFDFPPPSSSSEVKECNETMRLESSLGDRSYIATDKCQAIVLPKGVDGCIISIKSMVNKLTVASEEPMKGENWGGGVMFTGTRLNLSLGDYIKFIFSKKEWLIVNYF